MKIEKPCIYDLTELQIIKVKYYKVMFKYKGKEYLLILDSEDDGCISFYEREKVAPDRYVLNHIDSVYTCKVPSDLIKDISRGHPRHTVYSNVDRQYFIKILAELELIDGPYTKEFKEVREKEKELNEKIRTLQHEISDIYKEWRTTINKGSKIIGDRLRIQASERVKAAKPGDWCEEYKANYGDIHPEYGGILTDLYSLPFGSCFFCTHGNWYGYIGCDKHGDKTVFTDNENIAPRKLTAEHHSLYIKRSIDTPDIMKQNSNILDKSICNYNNGEIPFD